MSRQNYYLLLELEDHVDDYETIQKIIKQKRAEWSKLRNHPSKGNEFQAKIEALKGIEDVMKDPEQRHQEAHHAKEIVAAEKAKEERQKFSLLDSSIAIISKKGWIEEAEVQAMAIEFKITKEEVLERITLPIENRLTQSIKKKQRIHIAKAKEIAEYCTRLGIESSHVSKVPSLYDYLGLAPASSTDKLLDKADHRYKITVRKGKSANNNMEVTLLSYCKSIFQFERKKYNSELSQLRLKKLDDYLKIASASKSLTSIVIEELIRIAMSFGDIDEVEAKEYIDSYCVENGIKQEGGKEKGKPILFVKKCGFCGLVHDQSHQFCTRCKTQLDIKCPSCNHLSHSIDLACANCGFPVGNMANATRLMEIANTYIRREFFEEAKEYLSEVLVLWPNHPEAINKRKDIETKEEDVNRKLIKIQSLIEKNHFYEARSLIIELRNVVKTSYSLQSLEKECLERIHLAESFLRRAHQASDEETAAGYYYKAYEVSADCKEAKRMLEKWPPSLPTDLQVIPGQNRISISWQPSPSKGAITYRLLRKKIRESLYPDDGEILQESSDCSFVDETAEGGYNYYYTIYTIRGSVPSRYGLSKGPFIRYGEVEEIEIQQEEASIKISWKKPKRATKVEVWRKDEKVPLRRNDGKLVGIVTEDCFLDRDVNYGQIYGYRLVVVYEEKNIFYSEGKTLQTKAMRMPKLYKNLTLKRKQDEFELFWENTNDILDIYYSYAPFQVQIGQFVPLEELPVFEYKVDCSKGNSAMISVDMKKTVYFLPVTRNEEIAVYGQMKICKVYPEVNYVRHHINNNTLFLQWDWPKGIQSAVIAYRTDTFPETPDDPKATRSSIDKSSYDVLDGYTIAADERDYYVTIFTIFEEDGNTVHSNGINYLYMNSMFVDLSYSIKVSGVFNKKIRIFLTSEVPLTIPDLVLVKKEGMIPTKKDGGNVIHRIQAQTIEKAIAFEISNEHLQKDTFAKLFFANDQFAAKFRLQAEDGKESMKLW